jgi:hypothetical protein
MFNDSFAILIKKDTCANAEFENFATLKDPAEPEPDSFTLADVVLCGDPIFKRNQLAPSPPEFVGPPASPHAIDDTPGAEPFEYDTSVPYFDHEFGGFTMPMTRETATALSIGTYTIKVVIQDVSDANVDSGLFIETAGLKLFALAQGDYNGDGCVNTADYDVWDMNFGKEPATFYDGDGNGDCTVDQLDYIVWHNNLGATGNADLEADFDRDGCVMNSDLTILLDNWGLQECASRFEGDANGDGAVGNADLTALQNTWGQCGCGSQSASSGEELKAQLDAAGIEVDADFWESFGSGTESDGIAKDTGASMQALKERLPASADVDGDGDVDDADLSVLDAIVHGSHTDEPSADDSGLAPTPDDSTAESSPTVEEPSLLPPGAPRDFPQR